MIVTFQLARADADRLACHVPAGVRLHEAATLDRADVLLRRASGFVLAVGPTPDADVLARLRHVRREHPWLPVLLAVPDVAPHTDPAGRYLLERAGVDGLLRAAAPAQPITLRGHVSPLTTRQEWRSLPMRRLAAMVERQEHVAEAPRRLICSALCVVDPIESVDALAELADRGRASLWKLWQGSERPLPPAGAFVDWLHLLHAAVRKEEGRTWRSVAAELDARPSSVARLARRMLGRPLGTSDARVRRRLFSEFLRRMLRLTRFELHDLLTLAPAALPPRVGPEPVVPRLRQRSSRSARETSVSAPTSIALGEPSARARDNSRSRTNSVTSTSSSVLRSVAEDTLTSA